MKNALQLLTQDAITKAGKCSVCMTTPYLYCFLQVWRNLVKLIFNNAAEGSGRLPHS